MPAEIILAALITAAANNAPTFVKCLKAATKKIKKKAKSSKTNKATKAKKGEVSTGSTVRPSDQEEFPIVNSEEGRAEMAPPTPPKLTLKDILEMRAAEDKNSPSPKAVHSKTALATVPAEAPAAKFSTHKYGASRSRPNEAEEEERQRKKRKVSESQEGAEFVGAGSTDVPSHSDPTPSSSIIVTEEVNLIEETASIDADGGLAVALLPEDIEIEPKELDENLYHLMKATESMSMLYQQVINLNNLAKKYKKRANRALDKIQAAEKEAQGIREKNAALGRELESKAAYSHKDKVFGKGFEIGYHLGLDAMGVAADDPKRAVPEATPLILPVSSTEEVAADDAEAEDAEAQGTPLLAQPDDAAVPANAET